ncbi:hypothetical protein LSH36_279g03113 [Paralvinella palmiformis]|uniref:Small ribosomal subunit protein bS16m n=1 Tax=Paralvinella palmiformis TaxID=53620 RepID=A0AAD9JJ91_9ANNE|nr:hypothetical protein LSH36_279g03113 [Paralvinella palmiformis]
MPRRTLLAIRLTLHGCANRPFYHLVVMHAYKGRDNRVIEQIGSFDPLPNYKNEKLVGISFDRFNYWYSHGNVILTRPVEKLMGLCGYFPLHPMTYIKANRNRAKAKLEAEKRENVESSEEVPVS